MRTAVKALLIVLLIAGAIGLAFVYQPYSKQPINASVATSPHKVEHEETIVLKEARSGGGVSHEGFVAEVLNLQPGF